MRAVLSLETYEGTAEQLSELVAEMERSGWTSKVETIAGRMSILFKREVRK